MKHILCLIMLTGLIACASAKVDNKPHTPPSPPLVQVQDCLPGPIVNKKLTFICVKTR